MNTRVQVEHPVTEEVTGVDIVETGLRIAAGEPLSFTQDDVVHRGHAIEVRLNAEDAAAGFIPSPGPVSVYEEPSGPGIRVDSSLRGPGEVSESYDPLFAKLIVRGADRKGALGRLRRAIAEFRVEGISTTLPFFTALLDDEVFVSGEYTTRYVEERMDLLSMEPASGSAVSPERGEKSVREVDAEVNGRLFKVKLYAENSEDFGAPAGNGTGASSGPPKRRGSGGGSGRSAATAEGAIVAPMQGTILRVLVEEGQEVSADEPVCVLEAMKMESEVRATRDGTVSAVNVAAGQTVGAGEPLIVLD
jgi:acetyl-CoA/propionyl-CoA carboxylase biotin carboxyl carrier protein